MQKSHVFIGLASAAVLSVVAVCFFYCPQIAQKETFMPQAQEMQTTEPHIQTLKTPGGIEAWLVHSPEIPMISLEVTFRAGQAFLPPEQQGLAHMTAALIDEGAGEMDMQTFHKAFEGIGASIGADAGRLDFGINLTTLSEYKTEAFALLKKAVTQPRFDEDAIERIRASMLASLKREQENPDTIAGKAYRDIVFAGHPYALATEGTEETLKNITREDIQTYYQTQMNRANMVVSVVGDITVEELTEVLDEILLDLPDGVERNRITTAPTTPQAGETVIEKDIPQSSVVFGHLGLNRDHPQYYAATVMNHILGGGALTSRLGTEVREKRGLAYSVYSYFLPLPFKGTFTARVQTSNASVTQAMDLMKAEMHRIQDELVSEDEHEDAISYLTGSFPLRLDSNEKILNHLAFMQMEGLGVAYLQQWPEHIKKITREDIQNAAKELLTPEKVVTVIVGKPEGQ